MTQRKPLKDLTLLDRFLFAEAMEDPENMRTLLEIILGDDIVLKYLPQVEKEERKSPLYRFVKLDVWAQDMEDAVYDTEVQAKNTGNLPKRSRYYQGMIDSKLLEPGEINFNSLNPVFIIVIAPFDLFKKKKYKYTFKMKCVEAPEVELNDGAVRIFLNTHGRNPEEVSPELVELLHYMEHTNAKPKNGVESEKLNDFRKRVEAIKSNEEVSVRYMQEWEERELEKREAKESGKAEGKAEGKADEIGIIRRKLEKGLSVKEIAEWMELGNSYIDKIDMLLKKYPDESNVQIARRYLEQ